MKLFVWDFHGVLEKGNELAVGEISNHVLAERGYYQRFSDTEIEKLYGLKWYQYFEYLLPQESPETHLALQQACFLHSSNSLKIISRYIQLNDHVPEILSRISFKHQQIVISNTRSESLRMFLEAVNITSFFPSTHALAVDAHTKDPLRQKIHVLQEFLKDKSFEKVIVISDAPEDKALTLDKGIFYLYAHPFRKHKEGIADFKINDLREVLKEL